CPGRGGEPDVHGLLHGDHRPAVQQPQAGAVRPVQELRPHPVFARVRTDCGGKFSTCRPAATSWKPVATIRRHTMAGVDILMPLRAILNCSGLGATSRAVALSMSPRSTSCRKFSVKSIIPSW